MKQEIVLIKFSPNMAILTHGNFHLINRLHRTGTQLNATENGKPVKNTDIFKNLW